MWGCRRAEEIGETGFWTGTVINATDEQGGQSGKGKACDHGKDGEEEHHAEPDGLGCQHGKRRL